MCNRRWLALGLVIAMACMCLTACSPLIEDDEETLDVYATFFPIYMLTEPLMRGIPNAQLHCLVQPQDGCLRSYQLSDWDIYLLATSADAVIAGGRGLETFESTLFGLGENGPAVSAILYNLELYNRRVSHAQDETDSHIVGLNPHLYMSIDGARQMVESAGAMLMTFDPKYQGLYGVNIESTMTALDDLEKTTDGILGAYRGRHVILMNEAMIYIAQDYDLNVAAWIDRESGVNLYGVELEECLGTLSRADAQVILIEKQAPRALIDALEDAGYSVALIDTFSTHNADEGFDMYIQGQIDNAKAVRSAFDRVDEREAGHQ